MSKCPLPNTLCPLATLSKSVTIKHTHHVWTSPLLLGSTLSDRFALIGALIGVWFCPTFAADKRHPGSFHKSWWKSMDQSHSGSNVINPNSLLQKWNVLKDNII